MEARNQLCPTDRLHASGDVMVNSSELRAQVTDMQVWFTYPEVTLAKKQLADPRRCRWSGEGTAAASVGDITCGEISIGVRER